MSSQPKKKVDLCPRLREIIEETLGDLGIDLEGQGLLADEPALTTSKLVNAFDNLRRHVVCRETEFVGPPRRKRPFVLNTQTEG